ncbi:cadherin-17 [Takifugu rubripes]|uniref:Cadherin 17, LI cadherin (liver-intestine) n=1 Tax=Takifugu rubripes TaxID=31033 RepID=A0A674NY81_TAKRU|nr:cadherin-17 [Takifugu rubripes]XP_029695159.1 cadherin-17 [Takifugu rubripes]
MSPVLHLFLLPLLFCIAGGEELDEKKGPFTDTHLDVAEGTPVPYPLYQFLVTNPVDRFRISAEGGEEFRISSDGWLYLERPLDWSREDHYVMMIEALHEDTVVDGPISVTVNVLDINNNAPYFNQSVYTAWVREKSPAGSPVSRVFAMDQDDPTSPNADLYYSLVSQIPNKQNVAFFQINHQTGEISITEQGEEMLKAREGIQFNRGEEKTVETLRNKFNSYCPVQNVPYDQNPFYTCVERAELRRRNVDPLSDPDYTLMVRVQDLGGMSDTALSGNARVQIVVQENLWVNPGPVFVREHMTATYPLVITKVQSNEAGAIYTLTQKERELKFPFQITEDGEIQLTEELDREDKNMYILVVQATDPHGNDVDPPMEIVILVEDVNDNAPQCDHEESIFELQEQEPIGSMVGQLLVHDADEEGTLNAQLNYTILSQHPDTSPKSFSIDTTSGNIQALRILQRTEQKLYSLKVRVSDPDFSVDCNVLIKVIDVNNELPVFEKADYGSHTVAEDAPVGHTLLTITATDNDEPDSGSSTIYFNISSGNDDEFFTVETNGTGVGHVVIAKPLDFEVSPSLRLQIDARNPEPLTKGLEYGRESSAFVLVSLTDVDEVPEFSSHVLDVAVPENITKGSVLLTVEAADPEGKEISFKLDGDTWGWLEIDAATGEIRTKGELDRETVETFEVTVTAFEKDNPTMSSERVVSVRLLDVNDNFPKLVESKVFICVKKLEPVVLTATDKDNAPFSQPFTFSLANGRKSPNWELTSIDGSTAQLTLKKIPISDLTITLPITIKDHAGLGVTQGLSVRVCNCTELGYCYMAPESRGYMGMGPTVGILVGILLFCGVLFVIVIKRIEKGKKKQDGAAADDETKVIL